MRGKSGRGLCLSERLLRLPLRIRVARASLLWIEKRLRDVVTHSRPTPGDDKGKRYAPPALLNDKLFAL